MQQNLSFKKNSVHSGSYVISNRKNEILKAYLGTCVGVAIWDASNDIGGLIHLLLAEPIVEGNTMGSPENYALTGLPMFIRDLYKNGAKKKHLKAVVAGGVLVGPVSGMDINLDIGGRTTEVVERLLAMEDIPIVKMETGGYFSCCLSLNLSNWKSSIDLISMPDELPEIDFVKPSKTQLERAMADVRPIPQIVLKIIRMIQDDQCSMEDLAKEVRQEQVITAKVIRLCNTPFFKQRFKVDSIKKALLVLGEKRLLQLAISASMEDFFPKETGGYSFCKGGLFNHAVGTAMICEKLADMTGFVSDDIAYTAGLLHDIGKVVLDQYMGLVYPFFYRRIQNEDQNLIDVENDVFGVTHTEIGGLLADQWLIPEEIVEVIKFHHDPEQATLNPELTHIVYFADLILSRFMVSNEMDRLNTDYFSERLNKIGLTPEQFPAIIEKLSEEISNLSSYEKD